MQKSQLSTKPPPSVKAPPKVSVPAQKHQSMKVPKVELPPADKMSQQEIKAWAKAARNHNRQVLLKNGLEISPAGEVTINQEKAQQYEASLSLND